MSVLVLGTVALDNVKTPYGLRRKMLGGSASHFSMSARLFTRVEISAVVGKDFPARYSNLLRSKGVNLDSLLYSPGKTFEWTGKYEGDLNSAVTLKTELGVLSGFKPALSRQQKKAKYVFLANVDPDIQLHFLRQFCSPVLVALDSMNYWIDNKRKSLLKLLKNVDIYFANEKEASSLSGESGMVKAAKSLCRMGPKMVLIKKGEHGVLFYNGRYFFALPAFPSEEIIDPTGAGDTFAGGFMGYLAKSGKINDPVIKSALAYGTVAASFNIEGFGLEVSARLKMSDLDARLAKFKKYVLF